MYPCFNQSTSISDPRTTRNGPSTCARLGKNELTLLKDENNEDGRMVNDWGKMEDAVRGGVDSGVLFVIVDALPPRFHVDPKLPMKLNAPVSTILRDAMMVSMSQSWNRSTTSAQVSWKRFSFSNFLNTVDLISTNWFDSNSVINAFEYELTATFKVITW